MDKVYWSASGILILLVMKYCIVGLGWWNKVLHPGRVEPENLRKFHRPLLLGLFK